MQPDPVERVREGAPREVAIVVVVVKIAVFVVGVSASETLPAAETHDDRV